GGVDQISGDLGLAYRDSRRLGAGMGSMSWDQPHGSPSVRAGCELLQATLPYEADPNPVSCLMQPCVPRSLCAAQRLSGAGLLDRALAGNRRRALVAADRARRNEWPPPLRPAAEGPWRRP